MTELVITRGLPASGKSTWAKAWVAADIDHRARVNRDDLRQMLHNSAPHTWPQESAVTEAQHAAVRALLDRNRSVVVDDTNLRASTVRKLAEIGRSHGATVTVQDFPVEVDQLVEWDLVRSRARVFDFASGVGEDVIRGMARRYHVKPDGELPPVPDLVADAGGDLYEPDLDAPRAIIVDVDGTVAVNNGHRGWYDYHKVLGDLPNEPVIQAVGGFVYMQRVKVLYVSGRPDSCRKDTETWLDLYAPDGELFMRKHGDGRDDSVIKREIFDREIRNKYNVVAVFDDRNRVVRMWRALGLHVFQVADGDF